MKGKTLILLAVLALLPQPRPQAEGAAGKSARTVYEQGRVYQYQDDFIQAIELYRASLDLNPNFSAPLAGLAECFFTLEEYEESLRYAQRAQVLDRSSLDLKVLEGRIRLAQGEPELARALFQEVLSREPNNLEARFGLAELDITQGRQQNAAARYLESLKIAPDNRKALLSLALISEASGDKKAAQGYLELALRYYTNDAQVHYTAGRFALEQQDYEQAEKRLLTAISLNPKYLKAKQLLARVYLDSSRAEKSVQIIQETLAANRVDPLSWYILGLAYAQSGDTAQAVHSLSQVLLLAPDDEVALIALENIVLEKLPLKDPVRKRYGELHFRKGKLLEERNFLDKALWEYRRGLRLDPESKAGRLSYAGVFKTLGFPLKYRQELEVLKRLGLADTGILDDLEIVQSQSGGGVAERWAVDQYAVEKKKFSLAVFHQAATDKGIHPAFGRLLSEYFKDLVTRYENLGLTQEGAEVQGYEAAFRQARADGSHYFLLLGFEESERSLTVTLDQYLSRTGAKIASWRVYRTGNDRVRDGMVTLVSRLQQQLPLWGTLLAKQFDQGLLDLGAMSGIKENDQLLILKQGRVGLRNDTLGFSFREEDALGELKVTAVDENVAEGLILRKAFFDMVNTGDELVLSQPPKTETAPPPGPAKGLLQRLFSLVGWGAAK